MSGQGSPQLDRAVVARVVGATGAQRAHALFDDLWRSGEVRLADTEADDVGHRGNDVEELANARRRHRAHALGKALADDWLGGHLAPLSTASASLRRRR